MRVAPDDIIRLLLLLPAAAAALHWTSCWLLPSACTVSVLQAAARLASFP